MVLETSMVCHIRAFSVHFHVSSVLFLSGVKRPSGFANIAPRTCATGNFVHNIALVFFFWNEGARSSCWGVFTGLLVTCMS